MYPSSDPEALHLAAQAIGRSSLAQHLAYARLTPELTIARASPQLARFAQEPRTSLDGQALTKVFWEFIGAEESLRAVMRGELTEFVLERVNREVGTETRYFTFRVMCFDPAYPDAGLLLLVEEVTAAGQLEQRLTHDRNQLRLAQAALKQANRDLETLNRFKSFMLSTAAHDIRGPLTVIMGYTELLLGTLSPADPLKQRDQLTTIYAQAERLGQLIANILDLDQIERGRLVLKQGEFDLTTLIREVMELLQPLLLAQQQQLTLDLPTEAVMLRADRERVRQVLYNLTNNAIKYTPEGGAVRVSVRVMPTWVQVEIADTGHGLTEAQLENLFQLYYRTDEARQSKTAGSGLGLYIVKTLTEAQGGRVSVTSQRGQGSVFTVQWPR